MRRCIWIACWTIGIACAAVAADGPDTGWFGPAQDAADEIRAATGADVALLAAGMMFQKHEGPDLSKLFKYPWDTIVVSQLTGAQLRAALSRSISLYPSPNNGFLQLSGVEVTFKKSAPADERIVSVTIDGQALDDDAKYDVAMPIRLARGGYGYLKIWDKKSIKRTIDGLTLENLLKGKTATKQAPRWKAVD
ncbi:MAG: 5'-nucleotidase C-terminal domain-containing protein [Armatimonadetes bacterium]|nr:5'-nucleotidase C-terminal domain-containing protein [Armatimonadota bacterium]